MARNEWVSYALIAGALALGGIYLLDRDKPTTKEQGDRAGMLLRVFRDDEITRVNLRRRDETIELVKESDAWRMTSPRAAKADELAMMGFFNTLRGARSQRSLGVVKGGERAQLGLDAPRSVARIVMKGVVLELSLGAPATGAGVGDAGASSAYVEIAPYADQPGGVYVVEPDVAAVLDRGADAFRETSLVGNHLSPQYASIDVAGVVHLDRAAHGTFRLPGGVRADPDAADGLFLAMYELKAAPFVPDSSPIDVAKGALIEATLLAGGKVTVAFGGPCPADPGLVIAQARGDAIATGCIPRNVAERLRWPSEKYPDTHAFGLIHGATSAKISEIESVVVESGGKKVLDAERRGDGLHLRTPSDEQVDKDATERFLGRLAEVTGTLVQGADLAALGLAPPAGKVTVRRIVEARASEAGREAWEQVIEIGAPAADHTIHVRRLDDGAVLRVPLDRADPVLPSAVRSLRGGVLLQVAAESIVRVSAHPERDFAWELRKSGNVAWELISPPGLGADASGASKLATDLATLGCLRWLDRDDGTFGATRATLELQRNVDAGAEDATAVLEVGAEQNGTLVRVRGREPICVLPDEKVAALFRPPFDVRHVGFDPTIDGSRVVLAREKRVRTVTFDPVTKQWLDPSGGSEVLARKLGDALHGLRASAIVHVGASKKEEGFDAPTLLVEGFDGTKRKKALRVGVAGPAGTFYVRVEGTEATYLINKADLDPILESL